MANLQLTNDLIADALFRAGEPTDGTSDFHGQTLTYINRGYSIIWNGGSELDSDLNESWWWLQATAPGTLILEPKHDTGSVVVTNGSNTIQFTAGPSGSRAGWFLKTDDHADVFRISAHTAGATTATLDSVYTGDTATAAAYKIFKTEYGLATDVMYLISPMRAYRDNREKVEGIEPAALDRDWPLSDIDGGVPRAFANIGDRTVRFSHYGMATVGDLVRLDYDFLRIPPLLTTGATDAPLIPQQYRHILSDYVAFRLAQDKDDSKAVEFGTEARAGLRAMSKEHRRRMALVGRKFGAILTRQRNLHRSRQPLRTEAGLIIG